MATFENVKEAQEYFKKDRFATEAGMVIEELDEEHSLCSVTLSEVHQNANGGIMGGVMFTLGDFAFAALSNNIHFPTVAQEVNISFFNAPKGKKLYARSAVKKNGSRSMVIHVEISDDTGRDIAFFSGTGFKL